MEAASAALRSAASPRAATRILLRLNEKIKISMADAAMTEPREPVRNA